MMGRLSRSAVFILLSVALSACGGGLFGQNERTPQEEAQLRAERQQALVDDGTIPDPNRATIFDLFNSSADPNVSVEVNRYLWNASLEILDFMPIEAADPFSGVIAFGYGTPPGGSRAYRATVFVQDPALEARSLRVALQSRSGAVSRETARQIEDAILTRARQLRVRDSNL